MPNWVNYWHAIFQNCLRRRPETHCVLSVLREDQQLEEIMKHTYIEDIGKHEGQEVTLKGWLQNKRSSGKIQFLILRDGTGTIQGVVSKSAVAPEVFEQFERATQESALAVHGKVR